MAPLPSNNTPVLFIDYTVAGEQHTMQARPQTGSSNLDVMGVLADFWAAFDDSIYQTNIDGARGRAEGGVVTLPLTWTGDSAYGTADGDHNNTAQYYDFVGRSILGRRVKLSVFGAVVVVDTVEHDYRLTPSGNVLAALNVLKSNSDILGAIDGAQIIWYDYINTGINAYWRNKIR